MSLSKDKIDKQLQAMTVRKYNVAKSNILIQKTTTNLSLNEQKFILIALSKIQKEDDIYKTYTITIDDFCDILNIEKTAGGYLNTRFKTYLKKIADNSIWFYDEDLKAENLIRWFSKITVEYNEISFKFDESIHQYIYNLKEYFTVFELWNVLLLKSKKSIELYEFLKSYANVNNVPDFSVDFLKTKFNITHKTYSEFNRSFLKKCIAEINEKTDLRIAVHEIKKGKKVVKLKFHIDVLKNDDLAKQYSAVESAIQLKQVSPVFQKYLIE